MFGSAEFLDLRIISLSFLSPEELESCLDSEVLVGGLHEDSSSGAVQHSASAPHPPPTDAGPLLVSDSKHHRNLLNKSSYQNPLTTMVQGPVFLKTLCGSPGRTEAGVEGLKPQSSSSPDSVSIPVGLQSSFWRFLSSSYSPQTLSQKHMDSYIYSLLQRRAHPIRTSRPRTSISTDPSKSSLWHPGPSLRQVSGSCRAPGVKRSGSAEGTSVGTMSSPSNQKQGFMKSTNEVQDVPAGTDWIQTVHKTGLSSEFSSPGGPATNGDSNASTNRRSKRPEPIVPLLKDFKEQGRPAAIPHPKDPPCYPTDPDLLLKSIPEANTSSKSSPKVIQSGSTGKEERSSLETTSQILKGRKRRERGRMVNGRFYSTKQLSVKVHKANSKKSTRVKSSSENKEPLLERKTDKSLYNSGSKKSRPLEDRGPAHMKASRSGASSGRDTSLLPEGHVQSIPSKLTDVQSGSSKLHHHGNHSTNHRHHGYDQVVTAKPKNKRHDYRRLHTTVEIPQDGTHKCSWKQQKKKELMRIVNKDPPSGGQQTSPYVYVAGSDSEYSAECLSLFHSTVVDTSEDEKSNYTANCFGDCESSEEEEVEESSTTEESLEGVAGGVGRRGLQVRVRKGKQEVTQGQTKTFVKVKASYHLKKKILRSRSGSLRLMTTV